MIEIKVTCSGQEPEVHRFEGSRIRIGRGGDNDLVLSSRACSKHHAEIVQEGGTFKIVDLDSANGIRVGSKTLSELVLVHGAAVEIGEHTLSFSLPSAQEENTLVLGALDDKTVVLGRAKEPAAVAVEREEKPKLPVLYLVSRGKGRVHSLKVVPGTEYVIGRAPDADLVIDDGKSSKHHALVFSKEGRCYIRDKKSSNGTIVNGKKVEEAPLVPGSQIVIGTTLITVQEERHQLSDEAAILERTMLGSPGVGLHPGSAKGAGAAGPSSKGGALGIALGAAAIAAIAVGAFFVLGGRGGEPTDAGITDTETAAGSSAPRADALIVQVAPVARKELLRSVQGTATVSPRQRVTVSAEVPGRIVALSVDEGAAVERGQLLARINDTDIRLQIDEARSAVSQDRVDLAREDYERKQRLFDDGVTTRSILDQAQHHYLSLDSAFKSTQAKIQQLEQQLAKTRISAPISGRVAKKFMNQGEFVAPGAPLVTLENMEEVLVELELSDRDIVKVQKGQPVEARTDAFPERVFRGVVDNIASSANQVTRTFKVEASIGNQDGSLRSGMITSLRIVLEKTQALVVPVDALVDRRDDEADLFRVAEGTARKVKVRLGGLFDREVEVVEGLSEGDEVVVYGKERVSDGQPIGAYRRQ